MGTTLIYNGVELRNVVTREFVQDPVRDDSNTDTIHHRFRIQVETILNPSLLALANPRLGFLLPGGGVPTAAAAMQAIHRLLSQDRGELLYSFSGLPVLHVTPALSGAGNADANNGPRVFAVSMTHVSPETINILFGVECAMVVCEQSGTHPVLNNRWSSSDDVDENFKTTRNWRGKLRLRTAAVSAHVYRGIVVPPLPKGWRRKSMHFTAEPNALELSYAVTDEEITGQPAPSPATSMTCTHTKSLKTAGAIIEGHLSIRLDGPRGANKKVMMERCWQIALAKLNFAAGTSTNIVQSLDIVDHIGPSVNSVELNCSVLEAEALTDVGALNTKDFGKPYVWPPVYDLNTAQSLGPYGTASAVGLLACYLQSPCASVHDYPSQTQLTTDRAKKTLGEEPETQTTYTEGPAADQVPPVQYSTFHQQAIYTFLRIESHMVRHENRVHLPIAKQSPATGDTAVGIRLAPATAQRVIKVAAERVGAHVQLYEPKDFSAGGFGHKLLSANFNQRPKQISGDGHDRYSADAEYIYSLNRAPAPDEAIPIPALFWDNTTPSDSTFPSQQYLSPTGSKGLGGTFSIGT